MCSVLNMYGLNLSDYAGVAGIGDCCFWYDAGVALERMKYLVL